MGGPISAEKLDKSRTTGDEPGKNFTSTSKLLSKHKETITSIGEDMKNCNFQTLLVGIYNHEVTVEKSLAVFPKFAHRTTM